MENVGTIILPRVGITFQPRWIFYFEEMPETADSKWSRESETHSHAEACVPRSKEQAPFWKFPWLYTVEESAL